MLRLYPCGRGTAAVYDRSKPHSGSEKRNDRPVAGSKKPGLYTRAVTPCLSVTSGYCSGRCTRCPPSPQTRMLCVKPGSERCIARAEAPVLRAIYSSTISEIWTTGSTSV